MNGRSSRACRPPCRTASVSRLRAAAFALAHEGPVDALTVGDIVTRAGVSRQVFYQHFRDRDDAVASAVSAAFAAATADHSGDARTRILRLFDYAAEHRSAYRNVVPSAVTQRVAAAFRVELLPACEEIAAQGIPALTAVAGLTEEAVTRFLVGGFMEVLRSWMEDPDSTDLVDRAGAALDTVNALLGLTPSTNGLHHG